MIHTYVTLGTHLPLFFSSDHLNMSLSAWQYNGWRGEKSNSHLSRPSFAVVFIICCNLVWKVTTVGASTMYSGSKLYTSTKPNIEFLNISRYFPHMKLRNCCLCLFIASRPSGRIASCARTKCSRKWSGPSPITALWITANIAISRLEHSGARL